MTTIRLKSNSLRGANLSLSATQAGASDSNSATDWGSGTYAGELQVTVGRTVLQTAPDSVRFEVDLSKTTFDTKPIKDGSNWSPPHDDRYYAVKFHWDFGETRSFTAPTNVAPHWGNARYARGPFVKHMYSPESISGDWQDFFVYCKAYEPSSGKIATWSTTIRVYHPDYTYGGSRPGYSNAKTYVVNPNGDTDFTGKPTGATELVLDGTHGAAANVFSESITAWGTERTAGNYVRWLFKKGDTYSGAVTFASGDEQFQYFGSYGTGARPSFNTTGVMLNMSGAWSIVSALPELRFFGIDVDGGFDPATDNWGSNGTAGGTNPNSGGVNSSFMEANAPGSFVMAQDVIVSGMWNVHITSACDAEEMHTHFDNMLMHEFCCKPEYNVLLEKQAGPDNWTTQSTFSWTGVAHIMPPRGPSSFYNLTGTDWFHGIGRWNYKGRMHFRGCDIFHHGRTNGGFNPHTKSEMESTWAMRVTDGSEDYETTFPNLWTPDGAIINIHSCSFEGSVGSVGRVHPDSVWGQIIFKAFIVEDCFFCVGLYKSGEFAFNGHGCAFRNNLYFIPAFSARATTDGWRSIAFFDLGGYHDRGRRAPSRIYNCTLLCESVENNGTALFGNLNIIRTGNDSANPGTYWHTFNNIASGRNYTNATLTNENENVDYWDSDLDFTTEISWFTPRTIGRSQMDAQVGTLDALETSFAPTTGTILTGQPLAGSTITDASTATENRSSATSVAAYLPPHGAFGMTNEALFNDPTSGDFDKRGCWAEQAA